MTDTAELERLAASITPGPWELDGIVIAHQPEPTGYPVAVCLMGEPLEFPGDVKPMMENHEANARAIALVPDLLAEVIALRAEVERLNGALKSALADSAAAFLRASDAEVRATEIEAHLDISQNHEAGLIPIGTQVFLRRLAAHTQRVNAKELE